MTIQYTKNKRAFTLTDHKFIRVNKLSKRRQILAHIWAFNACWHWQ